MLGNLNWALQWYRNFGESKSIVTNLWYLYPNGIPFTIPSEPVPTPATIPLRVGTCPSWRSFPRTCSARRVRWAVLASGYSCYPSQWPCWYPSWWRPWLSDVGFSCRRSKFIAHRNGGGGPPSSQLRSCGKLLKILNWWLPVWYVHI